uniref:NADH-ubiquinone oxidoreductase chain 4 n=1 Tax=Virgulibracon endoxylaphagus TaxID=2933211 RepID=A0A8T9JCX1_9HYME|nr:NADH dehydrogenase subunit 4 [Virgulibracon endoxylaphagus]UOK09632.1 NADH dehydrogenase subunit 4 [Virgulibracon endoxylaphagus]
MYMILILIILNFKSLILFKNNFIFLILMCLMNLIFSMFIFLNFNYMNSFLWNYIYYIFGMDYLSMNLIFLTFWIMTFSMLSNLDNLLNNKKMIYMYLMMLLMLSLILTFLSMNILIFYIFFEISLIPIILIIMGWGYQIDRIQASMYMMFYTLFGSLPLLIMIMYLYSKMNSIMFIFLQMKIINLNNLYFFYMMNFAFLVKMPMYFMHLWLPKAHVEAPISGSMILAGVMLKLGSYGIYRFMLMFPSLYMNCNFLIIITLLGSLISSMICLNQSDMKVIIAYSSIVHMNMLLSSMFTLFFVSFKGSILMMIAHGLCSSGLFYIVNLNYERFNSRNIFINKGLINLLPSLSLWWFLMCSSNFSAPPSLNLFSEIFLLMGLIQWSNYLIVFIIMNLFLSSCYSIFLYGFIQYGKLNYMFYNFKMINCFEFMVLMMHWLPLNLIFLIF